RPRERKRHDFLARPVDATPQPTDHLKVPVVVARTGPAAATHPSETIQEWSAPIVARRNDLPERPIVVGDLAVHPRAHEPLGKIVRAVVVRDDWKRRAIALHVIVLTSHQQPREPILVEPHPREVGFLDLQLPVHEPRTSRVNVLHSLWAGFDVDTV